MAIEDSLPEDDPLDEPSPGEPSKGFVSDFVRRLAWTGLGAVFMSEEGIRRLGGQLKLPKEALAYLLTQAEKTKDEVARVVSEELRKFLQSERLRDELLKLVSQMTIELKAEIRLVPDRARGEPGLVEPKVKVSEVKTRYSAKKKASDSGGS